MNKASIRCTPPNDTHLSTLSGFYARPPMFMLHVGKDVMKQASMVPHKPGKNAHGDNQTRPPERLITSPDHRLEHVIYRGLSRNGNPI